MGRLLHRRALEECSEVGFARALRSAAPEVLFEGKSSKGNGCVRVTRYGTTASTWLALTFDDSQQGLTLESNPTEPCFEYVRTMVASAVGFAGLAGQGSSPRRVLCIGLGAGAMPAFLAHALPGAAVQVVEWDPLIIDVTARVLRVHFALLTSVEELLLPRAATPPPRPFAVAEGDGGEAVRLLAAAVAEGSQPGASLLLLDAFDGDGKIPAHLRAEAFLAACGRALAPDGLLVCNLFNGPAESRTRREMAFYARLLHTHVGPVWSVKVQAQQTNVILVAARRGSRLAAGPGPTREALVAATRAAALAGRWSFDGAELVGRMFRLVVRAAGVAETVPGRLVAWPPEDSAADSFASDSDSFARD